MKGYYIEMLLKGKGTERELRCLVWDINILSFSKNSFMVTGTSILLSQWKNLASIIGKEKKEKERSLR